MREARISRLECLLHQRYTSPGTVQSITICQNLSLGLCRTRIHYQYQWVVSSSHPVTRWWTAFVCFLERRRPLVSMRKRSVSISPRTIWNVWTKANFSMTISSISTFSKKMHSFDQERQCFSIALQHFRYVYYEKLSNEDRQRTYLFNSFFYTRLTRKGNDDIPNIS